MEGLAVSARSRQRYDGAWRTWQIILGFGRGRFYGNGACALSEEPPRRLKVWYHNGEENWDELCRRLDAVCRYYGVEHSDLEGWLCMTNPQKFPLRVAEIGSGDRFTPDRNLLAHMYEEISANEFEVISLDPLIALHGVPENNPVMMRGVMDIFRDLAASINCSCEIVGHTGPIGFDAQLTAYDTRGSGAIVDALRSMRMLDLMTVDEAQKVGVEEYRRERHVKVTPAKRNYSATSGPAQWIRIENLIIANGDDVGVVSPWEWPHLKSAGLDQPAHSLKQNALVYPLCVHKHPTNPQSRSPARGAVADGSGHAVASRLALVTGLERPMTMNTYEIAFAIFGLVMLAGAITGTKESTSIRLLAVVISLIAPMAAALAAIVSEGRR
jgi:hypothetical protein